MTAGDEFNTVNVDWTMRIHRLENEGFLFTFTMLTDQWWPSWSYTRIRLTSHFDKMDHTSIATTVAVAGVGALLYVSYRRFRDKKERLSQGKSSRRGGVATSIIKYGKPAVVQELRKPGYFITYNNQTKTPVYVIEKLTAENFTGSHVEQEVKVFRVDEAIRYEKIRSTNADYAGSVYDRGRMADVANHISKDTRLETLSLSNAVPQFSAFNKGNWTILEDYARGLVKTSTAVYVYSGPLFLPQEVGRSRDQYVIYQVIGDNKVAVPTHFFKILVVERPKEKPEVECYVVENTPFNAESLTPQEMAVDLKDIEIWSGLVFNKLHKLV